MESKYIIDTSGHPYIFEGQEYKEIDLSGIEEMTVQDAIEIQQHLFIEQEMAAAVICETTTAFAREIAARASKMPIEFFKLMPRGLGKRVVATVQSYFNVEIKTEHHVITLERPYQYKGQMYEDINLSGVADLNTMNESEAENQLARAGLPVVNRNSAYYLYACIIASMSTGRPVEFYTGLPLNELLKLKNGVNDPDFLS